MVFGFLLLLYFNDGIGWWDIVWFIMASLVIHSLPFLFIRFYPKPWIQTWTKYSLMSLAIFSFMFLIIAPNLIKDALIRKSNIGGYTYKSIVITDEECNRLNKYYEGKVCKDNVLSNVTARWVQGDIHLFSDTKNRYEISRKNIIRKIKAKSNIEKILLPKKVDL